MTRSSATDRDPPRPTGAARFSGPPPTPQKWARYFHHLHDTMFNIMATAKANPAGYRLVERYEY